MHPIGLFRFMISTIWLLGGRNGVHTSTGELQDWKFILILKIYHWKGGSSEPSEPLLPTPLYMETHKATFALYIRQHMENVPSLDYDNIANLSVNCHTENIDTKVKQIRNWQTAKMAAKMKQINNWLCSVNTSSQLIVAT